MKIGTVQEFLGLSDEEMALIELKRTLARKIKAVREANKITQQQLAKMIKSSQSRVAKIEAASENVSLDLMVTALSALGLTNKDIGKAISAR